MALAADKPVYIFEWSPKTETDRFHSHNHLELGYCISGSGSFYFGEKSYSVGPGDVFVVNNLERHAAASDPINPSNFYFVFFDPRIIEAVDSELLQPFIYRPGHFTYKIAAGEPAAVQIGSLIREMWQEYTAGQEGHKGVMLGQLIQISGLLMRHYGRHTSGKEWQHALHDYYRLIRALDFIKSRFREPITLSDVAGVMNISPSRARHFFKEKMGEGFKEYVTRLRIGEAKRMLAGTNLPISDILYECGYETTAPFYRAFKKHTGVSPAEYRKRESRIALFEKMEIDIEKTMHSTEPIMKLK
ncbi:AraC family transcriptional regulator [Paenibacillus beijingensis]|uniref:AraC family transcriptional regulator n=2 Tax=Paenibacillus beijingensis TaxID=1126833 RepID=A0A0D5NQ63_9BACL|nr:AraC family transcriptional regulator [Paenibacillus beijingensis]